VDADDDEDEEVPAPPTDAELTSSKQSQPTSTTGNTERGGVTQPAGPLPPPPGTNAYSRQAMGRRGARSKYVDVLNPSGNEVGGASAQAPPPGPPPAMMPTAVPPSFFVPQQPLPSGGEKPVADSQTRLTPATIQQATLSDITSHTQLNSDPQPQSSQDSRVPPQAPSTAQDNPFHMPPAPPSHTHQHRLPTNSPQGRPHPQPNMTEAPQPPVASQQHMPQFFNPSAFAPLSNPMVGRQSDAQDDAQSTVSELSQEVSRINSRQMFPAMATSRSAGYNKLRQGIRGARMAYPSSMPQPPPAGGHQTHRPAGGPPPRHK
jgi:hypothetical protein